MAITISGSTLTFNDGTTQTTAAGATYVRAWVNFNGFNPPSIRASFNVSSITYNTTGDFTVNFTSAMPDANYAAIGTRSTTTSARIAAVQFIWTQQYDTAGFRFLSKWESGSGGGSEDPHIANLAVFR
jgi:hypothetical protein